VPTSLFPKIIHQLCEFRVSDTDELVVCGEPDDKLLEVKTEPGGDAEVEDVVGDEGLITVGETTWFGLSVLLAGTALQAASSKTIPMANTVIMNRSLFDLIGMSLRTWPERLV